MRAVAAVAFRQETVFQMFVQTTEKNVSEDFPGDFQQADASVVIAGLAVPFPLVELDDCGVLEILEDFSLMPALLEERRQMIHELGAAMSVDLSRDCVRSGRFPAVELLYGLDGFLWRRRKVNIGVGLHLEQTGDGGVRDGGGVVDDASEVIGPSLWNWYLHDG
nr:unnamed protein product [Spirometra erinaceieuropaei]